MSNPVPKRKNKVQPEETTKCKEEAEKGKEKPIAEESLCAHTRRLLFEQLPDPPVFTPVPTRTPSPVLPPPGTAMATTTKGTMPDPSSKKAPRFEKKKPSKLYDFFEIFEEVAKGCGLDGKEKSKAVVRYTDDRTKRYWKTLDGYDTDFAQLKRSIIGTYSKTELEPSFSVKKLAKLVEKSAKTRISRDDQLSEYNRKFGYLASQLQAVKKLSDLNKKEYFWKGLHPSTRKKIRAHLEIRDPVLQCSDYHQ